MSDETIYSKELQESMAKVITSRPARMKQKLPTLTIEERRKLLEGFHPDYKPGSLRELKIGPNKGENIYHEYADLFETYSLINEKDIDLTKIDYDIDVLIIGGGGAGVAAGRAGAAGSAPHVAGTRTARGGRAGRPSGSRPVGAQPHHARKDAGHCPSGGAPSGG